MLTIAYRAAHNYQREKHEGYMVNVLCVNDSLGLGTGDGLETMVDGLGTGDGLETMVDGLGTGDGLGTTASW